MGRERTRQGWLFGVESPSADALLPADAQCKIERSKRADHRVWRRARVKWQPSSLRERPAPSSSHTTIHILAPSSRFCTIYLRGAIIILIMNIKSRRTHSFRHCYNVLPITKQSILQLASCLLLRLPPPPSPLRPPLSPPSPPSPPPNSLNPRPPPLTRCTGRRSSQPPRCVPAGTRWSASPP